jgi:DNA-binding SARP family transcriptional activator
LNRHSIDIVINLQEENPAELLIISGDRLSKRALKERKTAFLEKTIHFDFRFDLEGDQLSIIVGDFVFIENRLGLKPRTDYKILLGSGSAGSLSIKTVSALQIDNIRTYPDLISSRKKNTHNTLYWILFIVVLDLLVFAYIFNKKRIHKKQALLNTENIPEKELTYKIECDELYSGKKTDKSVIFLFGEFQVINKSGNDISKKFTPLLKELFLILLFHSQKENKAISNAALRDMLWLDKDVQSANNNRAVNIGKLKAILNDVGDYEIINNTLQLRIDLGRNISCDYYEFCDLLKEKTINKQQVIQLINIASRGSLLTECGYEWLDVFKANISDALIDTLLGFGRMIDLSKESRLIIQLSDMIFLFDPLNEEALNLKCRALIHSGKHSSAKATYTRFTKEYESLFSTPYKFSFSEVICVED